MTTHVVMFSGGIGSWAAAKRVAEQHDPKDMVLLFSDVKGSNGNDHIGEDPDTYRFVMDAARDIKATLVVVRDGRDIWQVFKDRRFLGNSRQANCSHSLKQIPARRWLNDNCDPADTVVYVGIDWTETHRLPAIEKNYQPYTAKAPLTEPPYWSKEEMISLARECNLQPPRLYELGFPHNNCGGGCVRAGQGQFKKLLDMMPERYAEWERQEQDVRDYLGKDVSILTEMRNGEKRNLPLVDLRKRVMSEPALFDDLDIGGCGCFVDYEDADV